MRATYTLSRLDSLLTKQFIQRTRIAKATPKDLALHARGHKKQSNGDSIFKVPYTVHRNQNE